MKTNLVGRPGGGSVAPIVGRISRPQWIIDEGSSHTLSWRRLGDQETVGVNPAGSRRDAACYDATGWPHAAPY